MLFILFYFKFYLAQVSRAGVARRVLVPGCATRKAGTYTNACLYLNFTKAQVP